MTGRPLPGQPSRLKDVADLADVSITTVSHVLNGTRRVAPHTRARVEQALEALDYQHTSTVRRAPKTKGAIGLTVTSGSNTYLGELIQGIQTETARAGFALFLSGSYDDSTHEERTVSTLLAHNVEALIVIPSPTWEIHTLPLLRRHDVPFVLVDRMSDIRCDQVGTENDSASSALVEHLLDLGHHRVAMLRGLHGLSTTDERVHGYSSALRSHAVDPADDLVVDGYSSVSGGRAAMRQLLHLANPPTAVFSANNAMTIGALQALKEADVQVPRDIALVAFDDFEWASAMTPALTAAAQPFHAMGARAVQLLVRRLNDPMAPRRIIRLPVEIEHRESCGCPPVHAPDQP